MSAATVGLYESNGASAVVTQCTALNFASTDSPNVSSAQYPIVISGGGYIGSYQKWERIGVSNMGTSHLISDILVWQSSNPGNGNTFNNTIVTWGVISSTSWCTQANTNVANNYLTYQAPVQTVGFSINGFANSSPYVFTGAHAGPLYIIASTPTATYAPSVDIGGIDAGTIGIASSSPTVTWTTPGVAVYSNYMVFQMLALSTITPNLSLSGSGGAPVFTFQYNES